MKKYSVMLVDDEEDVIQVIIRKIDWEAMGFEVMGYAHNGLEALEMAEERQPDVVMTDIKMPYMDGLSLSRKMKEQYPTVKIIIFSGFDEFEYAKEAIRLEAEEYILKPIDAEELSGVFARIRTALDREFDEKQNINMLKHYYTESLPILQENFYTALIEGRVPEAELQRSMMDYQVSLTGPWYCVVVLHNSSSLAPEGINPLLITMSVKKLAEEHLAEEYRAKFFSYLGNIVVITELMGEGEVTRLTDRCEVLCRLARHVSQATVTAGIGKPVSEIRKLPKSYDGARDAVSYRVLYGRGKAINIQEIAPEPHEAEQVTGPYEDQLNEVFKNIKTDSPDGLKEAVQTYLKGNLPPNPSIQEYRFFVMSLVTELYKFLRANHIDPDGVFGENTDIYKEVQALDVRELGSWMTEITRRMQESLKLARTDTTRTFVARAIDYVHDHFGDRDLSIERVCDFLSVSSAYFSTVFKRETGKTFINYLTDYRMEKAVRLLMEEEQKTYVVAEAVGYSDPNYFSYVFKKKFGMSPSKYRSSGK